MEKSVSPRVLILDDDAEFVSALASALRGNGYDVLEAVHPRTAIRVLEQAADLAAVVIDLCLPDVSGFEIIRLLTGRPHSVKVIATTAVYSDSTLYMLKQCGVDAVVHKSRNDPFRPEEWLETLARVLRPRVGGASA